MISMKTSKARVNWGKNLLGSDIIQYKKNNLIYQLPTMKHNDVSGHGVRAQPLRNRSSRSLQWDGVMA